MASKPALRAIWRRRKLEALFQRQLCEGAPVVRRTGVQFLLAKPQSNRAVRPQRGAFPEFWSFFMQRCCFSMLVVAAVTGSLILGCGQQGPSKKRVARTSADAV